MYDPDLDNSPFAPFNEIDESDPWGNDDFYRRRRRRRERLAEIADRAEWAGQE